MMEKLANYINGGWTVCPGEDEVLLDANTGDEIFSISSRDIDFAEVMDHGRRVGGPALRKLTFHQRGRILKALAKYLMERKAELYQLSPMTGATRTDSWIDIDGGFGTLFTYASKGRREAVDEPFFVDGSVEPLSRNGTFLGQHIAVPLEGVAAQINAFNFPCWGMLEKFGPAFLAGVPSVVKPASMGSYLTRKLVEMMLESELLPQGSLQLIIGEPRGILDHLSEQDAVAFTGSHATGIKLKQKQNIVEHSVRFNMEADSLNCAILGPDAVPGTEEFDLFIKEVAREMTVKAGQKCTAIRRTIVPEKMAGDVMDALKKQLAKITIGDVRREGVRMGPLAGKKQVEEIRRRLSELASGGELVYGDDSDFIVDGDREAGAFVPNTLFYCSEPLVAGAPHSVEAFGPVSTVMPYRTSEEAIELARRGRGSLVGSVVTYDDSFAREITFGLAPYHGRILVLNRDCAKESTGHGSPLPHLVHGGPGRAGGGEEMGGMRGTLHFMQRSAIQGSPTTLSVITRRAVRGMKEQTDRIHPFQKYYEELEIGETLVTHRRMVTEADVVNFAGISGDYFYAHVDPRGAARNSFFRKRVAHGYLIIAMAAGLFVWPGEGPVLANYGLDNLRFTQPVYIGDTIQVKMTCAQKTHKEKREDDEPASGVVHWDLEVVNQDNETVAQYTILTLVAKKHDDEEQI